MYWSTCVLFTLFLAIHASTLKGANPQIRTSSGCSAEIPADWPYVCEETSPRVLCIENSPDPLEPMPVNLTLAFFGDSGMDPPPYTSGRRVDLMRQLIREDRVEAFFHAGDFDYQDNPNIWDDQINAAIGPSFPFFSVIGNHDYPRWGTGNSNSYNVKIFNRYNAMGAKCWGDVGKDTVCSYKGFTFVTSGVGTDSVWDEPFIDAAFENFGGVWRMCMWHKNQHILQLGGKDDEVGWDAYNRCAKNGAFIINGHEHSYSRTKPISSYQDDAPTFNPIEDGDPLYTRPGLSWLAVVGTAGQPIRPCLNGLELNPWWGAYACTSSGFTDSAALVCKFNLNGNHRVAYCYMKTRGRLILDEFYVYSNNTVNYRCQNPATPIQDLPEGVSARSFAVSAQFESGSYWVPVTVAGFVLIVTVLVLIVILRNRQQQSPQISYSRI